MNGRNGPMPQGGPGGRPQAGPQGQQQQGGAPNGVNAQGQRGGPQAGGARAPPAGAGARPGGYRNNAANAANRSGAEGGANAASSSGTAGQSGSGSSLTAASLANATPAEQKQILGETIYPKIHASQPELAGKITGMLLEMDNAELLVLLEDDAALDSKVAEAMTVLEEYQKKSTDAPAEAASSDAAPAS